MSRYIIDLDKHFDDWFNEPEDFSLRSERFYDSLDQFTSRQGLIANLNLWLKAAYLHGVRTAAQDSCDTLRQYATDVAGLQAQLCTPQKKYDDAADGLMVYWTKALDRKENE